MSGRTIFRRVELWNADQVLMDVDIVVDEQGLVESIEKHQVDLEFIGKSIDLEGQVLMPSGVDLQVHVRVPGQLHKEKPETVCEAALRGGVGVVLNMPNTTPVVHSPEVLEEARALCVHAEEKTGVQILWSSAVTKDQKGEELVDFKAMHKTGVSAFTEDGVGIKKVEHLRAALKASEETGLPVLEHAELYEHEGVLGKGPVQEKLGVPCYEREAEWRFVERDLEQLKDFPRARYHVLHVSTRESIELIKEAKEASLPVTAEVSPHHLCFCSEDIEEQNTSFKMNPPLQGAEDRKRLREALAEGIVDYVATDHAPHEPEAKNKPFEKAAYGTTGLASSLRFLIKLYKEHLIDAKRLVELFSRKPAEFIGLGAEWGEISVGRPFRAVWVDVEAPEQALELSELHSFSKNNVFLGTPLPGKIRGHFNSSGHFLF